MYNRVYRASGNNVLYFFLLSLGFEALHLNTVFHPGENFDHTGEYLFDLGICDLNAFFPGEKWVPI